ncbi:MAG: hypothetical protein J07HX5_01613 [halophilic archaeon J07HX5]|jgi:hypothetical protein|nr:MAG: hypothetical protein J07HX5_01613 [halophilic archaeon J07HX5]
MSSIRYENEPDSYTEVEGVEIYYNGSQETFTFDDPDDGSSMEIPRERVYEIERA